MGMRRLISCMTYNIPYRIALFIWNIKLDVLCRPLHVYFRWEVALIGEFSTRHCLTPSRDPLSGTGSVRGDDAPMRP